MIGGGPAARTYYRPFLSRFVETAGGKDAKITILTAGSDEPQWANVDYWEILTGEGLRHLYSPLIADREAAKDEAMAEQIAASDGIYIAGGSQAAFMERLENTPTEDALRTVLKRGGILAGTSSGASVFGDVMILTGGTVDRHLRKDMIETGGGFGMLGENISVDTHCSSRGRLPRNIALLIDRPELQIIGIDEDTALYVDENGRAEVFGEHAVYILNGTGSRPGKLSIRDVTLHCLTEGDGYDIKNRQPI